MHLGPFEIGECIGEGGMGKIFSAVHETTGHPAAVKVILGDADGPSMAQFDREIQAHAGLIHPGVVYLFEHGTIDEEAAQASQGEWVANSPYVAMELADKGTVRDHLPIRDWSTLRRLLLQILDGLAFAHARGVIHRDLKPENFLLFSTDQEQRWKLKLADFGIAHAFGEEHIRDEKSLMAFSGTPYYMAPEQTRGMWRIYGPWTDIYALGCIVWELSCGRPPFVSDSAFTLALQHCDAERPRLEPQFDVPDELEAWVHRAMAIDPTQRFRRCADAANALPEAFAPACDGDFSSIDVPAGGALTKTLILNSAVAMTERWSEFKTERFGVDTVVPTIADRVPPSLIDAPASSDAGTEYSEHTDLSLTTMRTEVPDWRSQAFEQLPTQQIGTGLSLFGLRQVPFVDRDEQRDIIWQALRDVIEKRALRVVLIVGPVGTGKSRLAEWLATRVHELGVARTFQAQYSPRGQGPTEGFAGMIQRAFQSWKLPRGKLYKYLTTRVPEAEARALTELIHPTADDAVEVDGPRYQFASPRHKQALLVRVFASFMRQRQPLLWIDDMHWGSEACDLVEYLLKNSDRSPPGLVIATVRSEAVAERADLRRRLHEFCQFDQCQRIDLDALGDHDYRELVDRMLPLQPALGDELAERTDGTPLFAHQLLSAWIDAGLLQPGPQGFELSRDEDLTLPDDIHELWMTRVQRLADGYPDHLSSQIREAIELAAALGREVNAEEWQSVCDDAELDMPQRLVDDLIEWGLVDRSDDGWRFTHGLFVDSLERQAIDAGRWRDHHRLCAQMLSERSNSKGDPNSRRRADHWIAAREFEHALQPLFESIQRYFELGETTLWKQSLRQHRKLLDRLDKGPLAPQRLENDLVASRVLLFDGKTEAAIALATDVLQASRQINDDKLRLRAHEKLGAYLTWNEDLEGAQRELQAALELAEATGDEYWQGEVLFRMINVWYRVGDFDMADRCIRRAQKLLSKNGSVHDELLSRAWRGWVQLNRAHYAQGRQTFQTVLDEATKRGFRNIASHCLTGLGDIARYSEDLQEARRFYEEAHQIDLEMGDVHAELNSMQNLTQVELALGHLERGRRLLEDTQSRSQALDKEQDLELFDCMQLLLDCSHGAWSKVGLILDKYEEGWPEKRPVYKDHRWLLEIASGLADDAEKLDCARRLRQLADEVSKKLVDE